jgi:hypothetical protein
MFLTNRSLARRYAVFVYKIAEIRFKLIINQLCNIGTWGL